ncbi:MAG: DUF2339 domain-containing protein [Sphingobium sp.]
MTTMVLLLLVAVIVLAVQMRSLRDRISRLEDRLADAARVPSAAMPVPPEAVPVQAAPQPAEPPRRRPAVIIRDAPAPVDAVVPPADPALPEPSAPASAARPQGEPAAVLSRAAPVEAVAAPAPGKAEGLGFSFEDLFGRKLPIWAGGITLAVAGVLLVKYSIDAGLLSPLIRVIFGLLFGGALIGGAEAALRADERVGDPRVRQALAGAGIASLYAAILAASNLYHLVGPATAFAGLALVTALAMALSIRFGAPSALLGLVGGLAAPALVGEGPPNVPLLSAYLALAIGGLTALSRQQRWMWLGVGALIGGAGWGGLLILTGTLDWAGSLSLGLLVLLIGLALPLLAFTGVRAVLFRSVAALLASAQIALLVAKGGFAPLQWGLYLLLSAALGWLAWREERFRPLPPVGLAVGLLLAMLWPQPPAGQFAAIILLLAAIHAGPALVRLWRDGGGLIEAGQIAAVALVGHGVAWGHYPQAGDGLLALLAVAAALLPATGAALGWKQARPAGDARFVALAVPASLLLADAGWLALPHRLFPVVVAALAAGLVLLARAARDRRVEYGALAFLGGAIVALLATDALLAETGRLAGQAGDTVAAMALLRWSAVALAAFIGAWRLTLRARPGVEAVAAILAYGALAQVAPLWSLPVVASLGMAALVEGGRRLSGAARGAAPRAAAATLGAVAFLWALEPFGRWLVPALASAGGKAMLVGDVPLPVDSLTRLALPAAVVLLALWRVGEDAHARLRRTGFVLAALAGLAAAHSLYKQLFHLSGVEDVVRLGLAERTVWEALLLGAAFALWRWRGLGTAALAGAGAALLHGLWYNLVLLDPLATPVAVGSWPVGNLVTFSFAILFAALWLVERTMPAGRPLTGRAAHVLRMILIVLFAAMTLRQLFAGSLLVGPPVGSVENIGRSVLAIALAVGFLLWGIRTGRHDWRIGSLILMLAAVAKVFLLDAAGLEGLLRIVSFLALGFSLIGIGWLYSRFLRREEA